ncbi:hypothetical protein [Streptacidiphilus sp. EB129]|uniref:hypothetical protein n=1 Tax=Streptacidiphilus sp. EB129 TaxID=3156262 RepID=UPI0035188A48
MTDTSAALAQLDNASPPRFSARMTTGSSAPDAPADGILIEYAAADRWKVTDGDKVTIRNGAHAWTIWPDRVLIQPGERVVPPFVVLLWATYRSNGHRVESPREVVLDDGHPGYLATVSYRAGQTTTQWELGVDRGSGLVRHLKATPATSGTTGDAQLKAVNYTPELTDHTFEAVIPPAATVVDESHAEPGTAKRVLIALVARAFAQWNRLRHPERL